MSLKTFILDVNKLYNIDFDEKQIKKIINDSRLAAKLNYKKLPESKLMSESLYIQNWIREDILKEAHAKITNNYDYSASIELYNKYPPEIRKVVQRHVWSAAVHDRQKIFEDLISNYVEVEKAFQKLIEQRNKIASEKGYKNQLFFSLSQYTISISTFKKFLKGVGDAIDYSNDQLKKLKVDSLFYNEFGNHCYTCLIENLRYKNVEEISNQIVNSIQIPLFLQKKIKLNFADESKSFYQKETDLLFIYINKNQNLKHQFIDLIHEYSHIKSRLDCYNSGFFPEERGKYFSEKEALKIEIELIKKLSPDLYVSLFGEFLKVFHRVLFEINMYKKPNQNLFSLYAKMFKKCFKQTRIKTNRSFLLDDLIIESPFSNIPHAIAQSEVINDLFVSNNFHKNKVRP